MAGKPYPECGHLGSDVAELQAFATLLKVRNRLVDEGHSTECATLAVGTESPCTCDHRFRTLERKTKARKR